MVYYKQWSQYWAIRLVFFCCARIIFSGFINLTHQGGSYVQFSLSRTCKSNVANDLTKLLFFLFFSFFHIFSNRQQFIFYAGHLLLLGRPPVWMMTYGFLHGLSTNLSLNAAVVQSLPLPTFKGAYYNHKPSEHSARRQCQQGLSS